MKEIAQIKLWKYLVLLIIAFIAVPAQKCHAQKPDYSPHGIVAKGFIEILPGGCIILAGDTLCNWGNTNLITSLPTTDTTSIPIFNSNGFQGYAKLVEVDTGNVPAGSCIITSLPSSDTISIAFFDSSGFIGFGKVVAADTNNIEIDTSNIAGLNEFVLLRVNSESITKEFDSVIINNTDLAGVENYLYANLVEGYPFLHLVTYGFNIDADGPININSEDYDNGVTINSHLLNFNAGTIYMNASDGIVFTGRPIVYIHADFESEIVAPEEIRLESELVRIFNSTNEITFNSDTLNAKEEIGVFKQLLADSIFTTKSSTWADWVNAKNTESFNTHYKSFKSSNHLPAFDSLNRQNLNSYIYGLEIELERSYIYQARNRRLNTILFASLFSLIILLFVKLKTL